jgi:hypothetical protein
MNSVGRILNSEHSKLVRDEVIEKNSGKAFKVNRNQRIRIIGKTVVDFVAFNINDLSERFDQARTKSNQNKIYITKGDHLYSKRNNIMLTITEDTFEGHHDLQKGTCDRKRMEMAFKGSTPRLFAGYDVNPRDAKRWEDLPSHGCLENLSGALKEWGISPDDIPSPFNIFQDMEIDGKTGKMLNTMLRPKTDAYVEMLAKIDCLVGVSACPEGGRGQSIRVQICE